MSNKNLERKSVRGITPIESLRAITTFQGMSDGLLNALANVSMRKTLRMGQPLWRMGDPGEYIGVIVSGYLEVVRLASVGTEFCVGIFGPGDIIGISAVAARNAFPCTARSFTKHAEVVKIYLRPLMQRRDQPFAQEISERVSRMVLEHEQILRDKIDVISAGRTERRVFELLHHLDRRFGVKSSVTCSFIPLEISKTQVSRLVECRSETVIRLLSTWKKKELVRFERSGIHIMDWAKLEKSTRFELPDWPIKQSQRSLSHSARAVQ